MKVKLTAWNLLKQSVLSTAQVRNIDQLAISRYGMNSLVLMENAALGCVAWLQQKFSVAQNTVILCGRGNNGGDGLAMMRHLRVRGWPCQLFLLGPREKLSDDARANLDILLAGRPDGIHILDGENAASFSADLQDHLSKASLIVDAMLGTGAQGEPRSPLSEWIQLANDSQCFRLAIDNPTGVDAETGQRAAAAFRADATLTFVAQKPAMIGDGARDRFGQLEVLPIGVPEQLLQEVLESLD